MKPRHRISSTGKWAILGFAFTCDILMILFGLLAIVPIIGIIGTLANMLISIVELLGISFWIFMIGSSITAVFSKASLILLLQGAEFLTSITPFLGGIISFILSLSSTVYIYIFISRIEAEDREYNSKNGLA